MSNLLKDYGICNLLKKLNSDGKSTFFTFSQYTTDLTRQINLPSYQVVPSKFICLNLKQPDRTLNHDIVLPQLLQNYYENACCIGRSIASDDSDIFSKSKHEDYQLSNLLDLLYRNNYISYTSEVSNGETVYKCPDIQYIGEINSYSENDVNGVKYSEIYCYIPSTAKRQEWIVGSNVSEDITIEVESNGMIAGYDIASTRWNSTDFPIQYTAIFDDMVDMSYTYGGSNPGKLQPDITQGLSGSGFYEELSDESFEFNTIIVLYDIKATDTDGNIYDYLVNIPMGIHFNSSCNQSSSVGDTLMSRPIHKYVTNDDIFGQGTSYGLKICNRFVSSTVGDGISVGVVDESTDFTNSTEYSQVLSRINENITKMDDLSVAMLERNNEIKNSTANFESYRTNIPYIINVGGIDYWFVNGRSTGREVAANVSINWIDIEEPSTL